MDKHIPMLLGVSKSILENVIFCHQEESNWPLMDSRLLKQKFDDIFAATQYTKVLDHIKKLRLEQLKKLREYDSELKISQINVDTFNKLKDSYENIKLRIKDYKKLVKKYDDEIQVLITLNQSYSQISLSIRQIKNQINGHETEKRILINERDKIYTKISEGSLFDETLAYLKETYDNLHQQCTSEANKLQQIKNNLKNFEINIESNNYELQNLHQKWLEMNQLEKNILLDIEKKKNLKKSYSYFLM